MKGLIRMFDSKKLYEKLVEAGWNTGKIKYDPIASKMLSQSTLARLKNGDGNISIKGIESIAILLNMQPIDLLKEINWTVDLPNEPMRPTCKNQPKKKQQIAQNIHRNILEAVAKLHCLFLLLKKEQQHAVTTPL